MAVPPDVGASLRATHDELLPTVAQLALELGALAHAVGTEAAEELTRLTRDALAGGPHDGKDTDIAILHVLARAATNETSPVPAHIVALVSEWVKTHWKEIVLVQATIAHANPAQLAQLFEQIIDAHPDVVAMPIAGSILLPQADRERLLERIASDPRADVREHLYALLGQHQRLSPPGSLTLGKVGDAALQRILERGISDPVARVRERALALAYGLGKIESMLDRVLACVSDKAVDVRRYAIVALGAATDPRSLAVLVDRLERGERGDVASAIWALARRPDGIEHVLALAADAPRWAQPEILGAFAEVAPPLSDTQIARLRANLARPDFDEFAQRHLDRTRNVAPGVVPDARDVDR